MCYILGPDSGKRFMQMQQLLLQASQVMLISSGYHIFEWSCHLSKSQTVQAQLLLLHPPPPSQTSGQLNLKINAGALSSPISTSSSSN